MEAVFIADLMDRKTGRLGGIEVNGIHHREDNFHVDYWGGMV
jgi:hypothetical protein